MLYTGKLVVRSEGETDDTQTREYYEEVLGIPFPEELLSEDTTEEDEIMTMKVQFDLKDVAKLIENKTWVNGEKYPVTIVQFYSGEQMMFDEDFDELAELRHTLEQEES